jgi:uncharacterized repeat protein (TIGR01451 family)
MSTPARAATALVLGGIVLLVAAPAQAAPAGPQLSIAVDNGRASVKGGDTLSYAVTVTNLGAQAVRNVRLSQTLPAGSAFVSADSDGKHAAGVVSWRVGVKPSAKATVHVKLRAPKNPPQDLLRLASVACARVSIDGPPVVCAADSDQLPAGAASEAATRAAEQAPAPRPGFLESTADRLVAGGSAMAVLLAVLAMVGLQRRRADKLGLSRRDDLG